ncbi:DUF6485 family protein [Patescibacteria group bacterium]
MQCNIQNNLKNCNCTYDCDKKGKCCECVAYHRERQELPACYFLADKEKTYDRSIKNYLKL